MPPGGIRTHNLSRRAAAGLRLRPRFHWDLQDARYECKNKENREITISARKCIFNVFKSMRFVPTLKGNPSSFDVKSVTSFS